MSKFSQFGKYLLLSSLVLLLITQFNPTVLHSASPPAMESPHPQPSSTSPQSAPLYQLPTWARLVDIKTVNRNILLDIRYATTNNFLKRKLYPSARCLLRSSVAQKLSQVQQNLEKIGLGLKVYDCYRPLSVTRQMWEAMPDPRYVANPAQGSRHNRGAAVDVTLVDRNGKELEMPTEFDNFTEKAYRDYQGGSAASRKNSQLLEKVMREGGFVPLATEWWHFDAEDSQKFSILDIPFQWVP